MSDPHRDAFQHAQALARRSWPAAPLEFPDSRNHDISAVRSILTAGEDPARAILATVTGPQRADEDTVDDLLVDLEAVASQAGYFYGLAVGLLLGRGGPALMTKGTVQ
jgi:hypothetical protein